MRRPTLRITSSLPLIIGFVLAVFEPAVRAQIYGYSTYAGRAFAGSDDGAAGDARFSSPGALAADESGTVFVADTFNHAIRRITAAGIVSTIAGKAGFPGRVDGRGTQAQFNFPSGIAVDRGGGLVVADTYNHTVRRITAEGVVTTVAGSAGNRGSADGIGTAARFNRPTGIAVDASGNLFVADGGNATIRKITPAGVVTTIAGAAGVVGSADGDGREARFGQPAGLGFDRAGNLFVSDVFKTDRFFSGLRIRRIAPDGFVSTVADPSSAPISELRTPASVSDLAVDSTGAVFVSNPFTRTIAKLSPAGGWTIFAGKPSSSTAIDGLIDVATFVMPVALAADPRGNLYVADQGDVQSIRRISAAGPVTTLAGPLSKSASADGPRDQARFNSPRGLALDGSGALFVADFLNATIRKISATGVVTTFAGAAGMRGSADGTGASARFAGPAGLAFDGQGNLLVTDFGNHNVRKITPTGVVTTLAGGAGEAGSVDGPASSARFRFPAGVAVDRQGNVFVADSDNQTIRRISPDGRVSTFAGTAGSYGSADGIGTAARFAQPTGIAFDSAGNLIVSDRGGATLRKVTPDGVVTTIAGAFERIGRVDGTGGAARFNSPGALGFAANGDLLVTDRDALRKVTPAGLVTTIGGGGLGDYLGFIDGYGREAQFGALDGIAVDAAGNVFLADSAWATIRKGAVVASPARLINMSVLTSLRQKDDAVTLGAIVGGTGTSGVKSLLVRAAGPSLAVFGLSDFLPDPRLEFYSRTSRVAANDDWSSEPAAAAVFGQVGAFPFQSAASKDSALLIPSLAAGDYTARASGGSGVGTVLTELYDATPAASQTATSPRLANVSVLKAVGAGLTAGFVVRGEGVLTVLIRAIGPSLSPFGVSGWLANPQLEVFDGQSRSIASNDNWADADFVRYAAYDVFRAAFAHVGAFDISQGTSTDAALLMTVEPGNYTVQVKSADGSDGVVLVEVYEVR